LRGLIAAGRDEAVAIAAHEAPPLTYGALRALIDRAVRSLNDLGVGRGDRVGIVLPNGPEMATAFLCVASAAASAPLNPAYRQDEFEFYLEDLKAKALIVEAGKPNPNLNDGPQWGATLGNAILVWRSGIGIDRHGNLIYAAADYQTVGSLASILIRAGAVRAIQLDINAEWPSFITYGGWGARAPNKLVPNVQQSATRYLVPDDRDFFAIYRRVGSRSAMVPFS